MDIVNIETPAAAVIFALVFIFGARLHQPGNLKRRSMVSFSAGASVAYIFVYLSPELSGARHVFSEHAAATVLSHYTVNIATMLGFVIFYGLYHLNIRFGPKRSKNPENHNKEYMIYWLHVAVFGAYALLVSYLSVDSLDEEAVPVGLYVVAMGLHFLTVSQGLSKEFSTYYDRYKGPWLLAVCVLSGWVFGTLWDVSRPIVAILLGLVSGGVIVNTFVEELPKEKEGRFLPFVFGSLFFAALVLVLSE